MTAVVFDRYGGPEVLRLTRSPLPRVGPSDVLVAVKATSVNPVDCKIREGVQRALVHVKLPAILGMDVAGVVTEVGSSVTRFRVGDEVFASPNHRRMGTYAEFASVADAELAIKPSNITYEQAASLPLVALTAWDALIAWGKIESGERVLIQAGSGGVGSIAIQLAKARGAKVLATCSTRNVELVRGLGADEVIDYTQEDWAERAKGVDLIVDALGPDEVERAAGVVREGGRVISLSNGLPEATERHGAWLGTASALARVGRMAAGAWLRRRVRVIPMARRTSGENLRQIAALVEEGRIRPLIDSVMPLEEIVSAHQRVEAGRCRGKVVLKPTTIDA
ncbi:MAG: NADP-dependent oxidoreductase [Polyangiaceae bacterium]